jgi:hypothetical protein
MATIIIHLGGGLVQDVFLKGTGKVTKAIVLDYDVEGADADEIITCKDEDGGTQEAIVHTEGLNKLPKRSDVDLMVKAYLKTQR